MIPKIVRKKEKRIEYPDAPNRITGGVLPSNNQSLADIAVKTEIPPDPNRRHVLALSEKYE
jgi:hypothetical protein